tara:strand:- start:65 stop:358 length:294 start_codon:yes stop_codon:yes gene_type:complete
MKVEKLLEIQSKFEDRAVPCDMNEDDLEKHYSESKDKYINILDMDLIHLVRSYSKCIRKNNLTNKINDSDKEDLREKLDTILKETYNAREIIDKNEK